MKTKYKFLFLILFVSALANAQSINMRFSTQFYSWERADSINTDSRTAHIRGYQNLLLDVQKNKWGFNTLIQTEEDVINKVDKGFNYRFYNLYLKGTNLFNVLDLKLGRQYLFAGVGKGAIDGLNLKLKTGKNKEFQFSGYGGALTPGDYEIRDYPSLSDNYIFGGIFSYYGVRDFNASISYMNKHRKPEPYNAERFDDSLFAVKNVIIDIASPADQLAGVDFNYSHKKKHFFYGKAYFDINNNVFYKGEINANISLRNNLRLTAFYEYREPQISYNTIFWTFSHKQYQEVGGGLDYTLKNGINIYGKVSDVIYTDDNSLKIQAGFSHPSYGLSYTKYTGYAGESDGAYGYLYRELVRSKLSANLGISYSSYNIGDYSSEKENAFSGTLGFTFRPAPRFSVDLQGQFITNKIYKYDTRFLLGLNFWLFKKY